jgi:site-specific DNA-methyltransferase (adenine-specific)
MQWEILEGDALDVLDCVDGQAFDAVLCDPPYGISFMGAAWDHGVPSSEVWSKVYAALKPGAPLIAFGGTRAWHRLAVNIEDSGFEIRDTLIWLYGSGFPKSHDISKAIDKAAGAKREVVGKKTGRAASPVSDMRGGRMHAGGTTAGGYDNSDITAPATPQAQRWQGYGTALKPAWEPAILAFKPREGTYAENVLTHGMGGLNIDGCRVGTDDCLNGGAYSPETTKAKGSSFTMGVVGKGYRQPDGRFPANVLHDGSEEVVAGFPVTGPSKATPRKNGEFKSQSKGRDLPHVTHGHADNGGSAARYFYCAKASKSEREAGLADFGRHKVNDGRDTPMDTPFQRGETKRQNTHPCVKPLALIEYLAKLILPPPREDGKPRRILVPYSGSGSEVIGCLLAGWDEVVGIEIDSGYCEIARARIAHHMKPPAQVAI